MTISYRVRMQLQGYEAPTPIDQSPITKPLTLSTTSKPKAKKSVDGSKNADQLKKTRKRAEYWTKEEHKRFFQALERFPEGPWKCIAQYVGTKTARQAMTHAQKYRQKLMRRQQKQRMLQSSQESFMLNGNPLAMPLPQHQFQQHLRVSMGAMPNCHQQAEYAPATTHYLPLSHHCHYHPVLVHQDYSPSPWYNHSLSSISSSDSIHATTTTAYSPTASSTCSSSLSPSIDRHHMHHRDDNSVGGYEQPAFQDVLTQLASYE